MKIKKSELIKIIQEEAVKVKKVKLLEAEKKEIMTQLSEIYEGEDLEEILGFGKKNPRELEQIGMQAIKKHPAKRQVYTQLRADGDFEKAKKYAVAIGGNPKIMSWKWDDGRQNWIEAGSFGVPQNVPGAPGPGPSLGEAVDTTKDSK